MSLRFGAVPEQVNIPLSIANELGIFSRFGINVEIVTVQGGTGAMIEQIEKQELHIASPVTDAALAGAANGKCIQIFGEYVSSPLIWTVCVSPSAQFKSVKDLFGRRIGISRIGSGSHTMAKFMAYKHGFDPESLEFIVKNDFRGLRQGIENNEIDAFLWEKFTTKPYLDGKTLELLGDVETLWPAFSFAVNKNVVQNNPELVNTIEQRLFPSIKIACEIFKSNKESSINRIVRDFKHSREDAEIWLNKVQYSQSFQPNLKNLQQALDFMNGCGIVKNPTSSSSLCVSTLSSPLLTKNIQNNTKSFFGNRYIPELLQKGSAFLHRLSRLV